MYCLITSDNFNYDHLTITQLYFCFRIQRQNDDNKWQLADININDKKNTFLLFIKSLDLFFVFCYCICVWLIVVVDCIGLFCYCYNE